MYLYVSYPPLFCIIMAQDENGLCKEIQEKLRFPEEEARAQGHPTLRRENAELQEAGTNEKNDAPQGNGDYLGKEKGPHDRLADGVGRVWYSNIAAGADNGWPHSPAMVPYPSPEGRGQRWTNHELKRTPGRVLQGSLREVYAKDERVEPVQVEKDSDRDQGST